MKICMQKLAACAVFGLVTFAGTNSFAQGTSVDVGPPVYYGPYVAPYASGWWQYHGGPKSTETTDVYHGYYGYGYYGSPRPDLYAPAPYGGEVIGPRY